MRLRIGNVELENNLILAPMAGVTDMSFRQLCREQGCGLLVTEMVSAKAILYKNRNTKDLMAIGEGERPVSIQLFGSDPEIVSDIAHQIEDGPYDIIDLNMGCPVPKIVGNGEGSALMKNPKLVEELLSSLVKRYTSRLPSSSAKVSTMTMSMPWRSRRSQKAAASLRWPCTEEQGNSTIPARQTGTSSGR